MIGATDTSQKCYLLHTEHSLARPPRALRWHDTVGEAASRRSTARQRQGGDGTGAVAQTCHFPPQSYAKLYGKRIFSDTDRERIDRLDGMERHIKGTGEQGFHMQGNDLVQRLRDRAYGCKVPDPLVEEAADEIERLRSQPCPYVTGRVTKYCTLSSPSLTDAEREAVEVAALACASCNGFAGDPRIPAVYQGNEVAATLRALLERLA